VSNVLKQNEILITLPHIPVYIAEIALQDQRGALDCVNRVFEMMKQ
jgi:hypothetical protein